MTTITVTPPNQSPIIIEGYNSVSVRTNITDRAGSFSVELPFEKHVDITDIVVGSDVEINQNGHVFRGYVTKPPLKLKGMVKTLTLEGADYSAKTQKIVCTESYTNKSISYIITDLFAKYTSFDLNIQSCPMVIDFFAPDLFLWDIMEQFCQMSGYQWNIDSDLQVNFFSPALRVNPNVITENTFRRGTASFSWDASKLVNKLWVKGSNTLSPVFTETKTISSTPISLLYKPHNISINIGGSSKTVGIQNVDDAVTKDFLLNYNDKVLIPDLCTTGSATISYQYYYPTKVLLYEDSSIETYGLFEDILKVNTGDTDIATQMGLTYLAKYSRPVLVGSIEPISGNYTAGESVLVTLPDLNINEYLIIKSVEYVSNPLKPVQIKLSLENTIGDLVDILKQFQQRLDKIEALNSQENNEIVQQYRTYNDKLIYPKLNDLGISTLLHDYLLCGIPYAGNFYI